jgi:DNA-binding response OmpR family regulator
MVARSQSAAPATDLARPTTDGARVLLLQDELRLGEVVASGLRRDGHEVVVAEDGEVGVFLASTEPFDLFVLDLPLDGEPALELLRQVRSACEDAPVIVLSARDDPGARRVFEAAGASAFMPRPLVIARLRARVNEQLEQFARREG